MVYVPLCISKYSSPDQLHKLSASSLSIPSKNDRGVENSILIIRIKHTLLAILHVPFLHTNSYILRKLSISDLLYVEVIRGVDIVKHTLQNTDCGQRVLVLYNAHFVCIAIFGMM